MKTTLIMVGKTINKHLVALQKDYSDRISHYTRFEQTVIPELKNTKNLSHEEQKVREGKLIMQHIQPTDTVVLLDERGKAFRSIAFASWMEDMQNKTRHLVFIIGGPYGFSQEVYARANFQLTLSPMTFSHQMVRTIFLEQLYRAHTIIKGEPYHHE